jgi:hypothetical protein
VLGRGSRYNFPPRERTGSRQYRFQRCPTFHILQFLVNY